MPSQLQQESIEVVLNGQTDITTSSFSPQKVVEDWQGAIIAGAGVHRRLQRTGKMLSPLAASVHRRL
jgi:hypothetical protein